jgi:hypothetical protein
LHCSRHFPFLQQQFDPLQPRLTAGIGCLTAIMLQTVHRPLLANQMEALVSLSWI